MSLIDPKTVPRRKPSTITAMAVTVMIRADWLPIADPAVRCSRGGSVVRAGIRTKSV
jgi:hypothetical protein